MIPDFKTYIKESIWSDMEDRGTNTILKKEDEVNVLGLDRLCKYLNQIYGEFDHRESIKVNEWKGSRWLTIYLADTTSGYVLLISYDICPETEEKIISMSYELVKDWLDFNKFEKRYNSKVEKNEYDNDILTVYPKDGSEVTNEFLIDVIDYMLGEIPPGNDKYIYKRNNESIWSDMEDRGSGEIEKKEDDINNLDPDGLCDYIKDNYQFLTHEQWPIYVFQNKSTSETTMFVLVFFESGRTLPNVPVYITFNPVDIQFMPANMPGRDVIKYFDDDKLLDALKSSFDLVEDEKDGRNYHINPLNGENADNKFILKVLDTFAENSRRPIIKKK